MGVSDHVFYDTEKIAIVPMGFCYPGKGTSGDLPPRTECAPEWHKKLLEKMDEVSLTLLVGQYAQRYYLNKSFRQNLTETVRSFEQYGDFFPLPHPSPRNRFWLKKNDWFETTVIPALQERVKKALKG